MFRHRSDYRRRIHASAEEGAQRYIAHQTKPDSVVNQRAKLFGRLRFRAKASLCAEFGGEIPVAHDAKAARQVKLCVTRGRKTLDPGKQAAVARNIV